MRITRKFYERASILAAALFIAGCAAPPRATFTPLPFDQAEYAALQVTGTGIVRGQVFATTVGGDVKKGAGNSVVLFPATRYGEQRYAEQVVGNKLAVIAEDERYKNYVLTKTTDGDGRFEFLNVPPGSYYVVSNVTWAVIQATAFGPIRSQQGGTAAKKIEVSNGKITDAILTP